MIESTIEINATDTQSAVPKKPDNDPIVLPDEEIKLPIEDDKLHQMQREDKFCTQHHTTTGDWKTLCKESILSRRRNSKKICG